MLTENPGAAGSDRDPKTREAKMQQLPSAPRTGSPHGTIRPFTRIVAAIIIPFLLAAFLILYFFPEETGRRFAWEIRPAMTAIWMGAGYLGGAYFFLRVLLGGRWSHVAAGFWGVTAFTWAMLLATVLHWSRFDLGHLPFQIWLVLYVVTPFLVPLVWWLNRTDHDDAGDGDGDDVVVPAAARAGMAAVGVFMLASFAITFIAPQLAIDFWPWTLTPLTARIMGGWFALMGAGSLALARESRWSAWRYEVESIIFVWHALVLLGALMHVEDFKPGTAWFFIGEVTGIIALLALYVFMQRQKAGRSRLSQEQEPGG
jgi:hypothetical protein